MVFRRGKVFRCVNVCVSVCLSTLFVCTLFLRRSGKLSSFSELGCCLDVWMFVALYFNMTFGGIASVRFFRGHILGCVDVCRSIFQYDF